MRTGIYVTVVLDRKEGLIITGHRTAHDAWENLRLNYAPEVEEEPEYPEQLADALEAQDLTWAIEEVEVVEP